MTICLIEIWVKPVNFDRPHNFRAMRFFVSLSSFVGSFVSVYWAAKIITCIYIESFPYQCESHWLWLSFIEQSPGFGVNSINRSVTHVPKGFPPFAFNRMKYEVNISTHTHTHTKSNKLNENLNKLFGLNLVTNFTFTLSPFPRRRSPSSNFSFSLAHSVVTRPPHPNRLSVRINEKCSHILLRKKH